MVEYSRCLGDIFNGSGMRILFKYPSRGRPSRFFDGLDSIYNNIADKNNFHVACTLDVDDLAMNNEEIGNRIRAYGNISIQWGLSENKVHAINRDMPEYDWDILILMSDDMRVTFYGFDEAVRNCFSDGLDWHIHLPDQDEKEKLPVLYIAGKDFFNRFGWIYNPVYLSLFPDTELMHVAKHLGRYKFVNWPGMFEHLLPAYGHLPEDRQWREQQDIGWTVDHKTFLERQANNFYL